MGCCGEKANTRLGIVDCCPLEQPRHCRRPRPVDGPDFTAQKAAAADGEERAALEEPGGRAMLLTVA